MTARLPLAALVAAVALPAAAQPSFDCRRAATVVEVTICRSSALSALDREMAAAFLRRGGDPGVAADQRAWLARRDRDCSRGDPEGCLASLYAARLEELRRDGK